MYNDKFFSSFIIHNNIGSIDNVGQLRNVEAFTPKDIKKGFLIIYSEPKLLHLFWCEITKKMQNLQISFP